MDKPDCSGKRKVCGSLAAVDEILNYEKASGRRQCRRNILLFTIPETHNKNNTNKKIFHLQSRIKN